ncbi:hypothetical protein LSUE1_G009163 [Lachnellula suecica]|uniref:Uncharacterized protein n=1 Tax=Lachnellula suecica TaxID=602035 RepID=A0A8T9C6W1_9HELO|nr:hypothetical protein LSUE1_G009163 [Lachnellula suecica]
MAGYNAHHGFDTGPPPPSFGPMQGGRGRGYAPAPQFQNPIPQFQNYGPAYGYPQQQMQMPMYNYPNYQNGMPGQTFPAPAPRTDHGYPGIHLRNYTGGVGMQPGYDYLYPTNHAMIHVIKGKTPPWQSGTILHSWDNNMHTKLLVATCMTVEMLMKGLGLDNKEAKKNVVYEVTESGNGKWSKGLTINGDGDKCKKAIAEYGWNEKRTGQPGQPPVVWLWATKE